VSRHRAVPLGLAALLAALSMISPFSIDTFFPSFRAMQHEFGVSGLQMQQTLTAYMLPFAITSLVHGPLSDALGRRAVVLWGLAIYVLASAACALAPGFGTLLLFRAAQGMTAGVGMTVGRAVIRDRYDGPEAQRLMSVVTMIFSIAPAVAPIVGGWIHVAFGWRAVFGFLCVFGFALWLATRLYLDESHPPERRVPFDVLGLARTAWRIASDRRFLLLAIAAGANFAMTMSFVGSAPAIVLDNWKLSETQFAWLFVPVVTGFLIGAGLSGRLAGRLDPARQVNIGLGLAILAGLCGVALYSLVSSPPIALQQLLLLVTALGVQLVFPPLTLRMMDLFPEVRGSVSSVHSFISLLIGSLVLGLVVPWYGGSMLWLSIGSLAAALTSMTLWRISIRRS
jgi:DHA1 family bicyclomycin/chloramphenicol resistance-like MFS transporter